MKAKLKKTGEIINIAKYDMVKLDKCDSYGCNIEVPYEEVEQFYDDKGVPLGMPIIFPSVIESDFSIDWEKRRYEVAKDLLAAFMSNSCSNVFGGSKESQAKDAVEYADALIAELKKGGEK